MISFSILSVSGVQGIDDDGGQSGMELFRKIGA
jgi:hypothetical protein